MCRKKFRRLLVVFSLLMYVGSAHGMIFLMDISKGSDPQHAMHTNAKVMVHDTASGINIDSHLAHSKEHINNNATSMLDHDMQSCFDHCLASVAISYSFSDFVLPQDQSVLITSFDATFYSLQADIVSPPPKLKLL